MSNYFQVLKRIEKDRAGTVAAIPAAEPDPAPAAAPREVAPSAPAAIIEEHVAPEAHPPVRPRRAVHTPQPVSDTPPAEAPVRAVPRLRNATTNSTRLTP